MRAEYWYGVTKADGVKCPRCWRWTGEGRVNFDGLCDRCCEVLMRDYPTHPAVPYIDECRAVQRVRWGFGRPHDWREAGGAGYVCTDCLMRVTMVEEMSLTRCPVSYDRQWARPVERSCATA